MDERENKGAFGAELLSPTIKMFGLILFEKNSKQQNTR